ncbi:MAG TPA: DUF2189 domain-containing protein [Burkholderiaceae bacterium]|nr:DUF2189 domain-containing protein [Burkholderiaceae bacterium]
MNPETSTQPPPAKPLPTPFPPIDRVAPGAAFGWLVAGIRDLRRAPLPSLAYGVVFALMGWLIAFVFRYAYEYTSALTAGFLLLGPFLATGFYDISRRLQRGETVSLGDTMTAWRANLGAFSLFALVLTIIMLIWARASLVTFALFFSSGMPTLESFLGRVMSVEHLDFLVTYFAVGALFAAIVFAVSVVSVPMMLDRGTDTIVAALTSVRALFANPLPLLVWALLIVIVIGAGFATFFVGLVVAAPVIGHATWHAYRALVAEDVRDGTVSRTSEAPH